MKSFHVLGEHYNARGLSPEMIATSFVPPSQFWEVSAKSNCVIVGPRGSGKTTLLRMLDPRALRVWAADSYQRPGSPDYVGVFVPIDAAWISALTHAVRPNTDSDGGPAYLSVYALSVARSLLEVMRWRLSGDSLGSIFHVQSGVVDEQELAQKLAELWLPNRNVRSLLELRVAVATEIATLPRKWQRLPEGERDEVVAPYLNPLELTAAACDVFNAFSGDGERKWALLCDELEIAPLPVQEVLFAALRAAPSPLLLKYALTPRRRIPFGEGSERPLPANDFDLISLSYATREEGAPEQEREKFCVALWESLVTELCPDRIDILSSPFRVLENPNVASRRDRKYQEDIEVKFGQVFRDLAQKDSSFREYVQSKGVILSDLNKTEQKVRDSVVRKVRPIAEIRNYYLSSDGDEKLRRTSRRNLAPYCGAERIFSVSEGHPRWLKYTLASMLSYLNARDRIRVADQNRELEHSLQRIESRIRALPTEQMSTYDLIESIGTYFRNQVLGPAFRPDPSLSFTVDEGVNEEVIACLEQALYIGAVIPRNGEVVNMFTKGLVGQRLRLSNWLAPFYRLPLVAGKATNLSTIISNVEVDSAQFSLGLSNESVH